jgi:hypothetical protein
MTINDSQRAALKQIRDAAIPVRYRSAANPAAPHHKTIEGLRSRFLIEPKGDGYVISKAGLEALAIAKS